MHLFKCDDNCRIIATLSHQFTASSPQEAREWVKQISFLLTGKPASVCTFFVYVFWKRVPCFVASFSLFCVSLFKSMV